MGEEVIKKEIESILKKFNQITLVGLKRELREKEIPFTDKQLSNAVGSMFLEDKILLTGWS